MWARVFSPTETELAVPLIQQRLHELGVPDFVEVKGDELGWTSLRADTLVIERYLLEADDLRGELDAWAAVVEAWDAGSVGRDLMQRFITVRQVVTLTGLDCQLLTTLAQFFAGALSGFYQVDEVGIYESSGQILVAEPSSSEPE
jgi:hypothetical protein